MTDRQRPIAVLVVACIYFAVGCIGFAYHFHNLWQPDGVWVEVTEGLAIVIGVFLLRGRNWARWLALAWMAFHVAISYGDLWKLMIHSCILVLIAWLLFRRDTGRYFRDSEVQE